MTNNNSSSTTTDRLIIIGSTQQQQPRSKTKGPWHKDEDQALLYWVNQLGTGKWVEIAKRVGSRSGKQCRERWTNQLSPEIDHSPFRPDEDMLIITIQQTLQANRWSEVAKHLPGRPENAIKNRWNSRDLQRKRHQLFSQSTSPTQPPPPPPGLPYQQPKHSRLTQPPNTLHSLINHHYSTPINTQPSNYHHHHPIDSTPSWTSASSHQSHLLDYPSIYTPPSSSFIHNHHPPSLPLFPQHLFLDNHPPPNFFSFKPSPDTQPTQQQPLLPLSQHNPTTLPTAPESASNAPLEPTRSPHPITSNPFPNNSTSLPMSSFLGHWTPADHPLLGLDSSLSSTTLPLLPSASSSDPPLSHLYHHQQQQQQHKHNQSNSPSSSSSSPSPSSSSSTLLSTF